MHASGTDNEADFLDRCHQDASRFAQMIADER